MVAVAPGVEGVSIAAKPVWHLHLDLHPYGRSEGAVPPSFAFGEHCFGSTLAICRSHLLFRLESTADSRERQLVCVPTGDARIRRAETGRVAIGAQHSPRPPQVLLLVCTVECSRVESARVRSADWIAPHRRRGVVRPGRKVGDGLHGT